MPRTAPDFIAADLLVWTDDGIRLVASRDPGNNRITFPPRTGDDRFEPILLPPRGRLWSWTVQRFRPKSPPYAGPESFEAYAVGYIELDGMLIVESRLVGVAFEGLRIGMPMRLVPYIFEMASGDMRTSFAFMPDEEGK